MRCDVAEQLASAALDEPLPDRQAAALGDHQRSCPSCKAFSDHVLILRQRLRLQPLGHVPDVSAQVRQRVESGARGPAAGAGVRGLLRVAAVFIAAFAASALVVAQLAPAPVLAEDLGARIVAAQTRVRALSAELSVVERGWHPDVGRRVYEGRLEYDAPETLRVRLEDRTTYPSTQWVPNTTDWFVGDDVATLTGLRPCPTTLQPSCSASGARTDSWRGRGPFDDDVPAPLDLVVPTTSFALTGPVRELGVRTIGGVDALGVRVTVAQAAPLLDGILTVGNWRDLHHSDVAEVWLDARWLTPVAVDVMPADTAERRLWAASRTLEDPPGERVLQIVWRNVRFGEEADAVPRPAAPAADATDAGFVSVSRPSGALTPGWLPDGLVEHRAGRRGDLTITTWTDGRAWLRVEVAHAWAGQRLFGNLGEQVRPVDLGTGTAYIGGDGTTIGIHADAVDVALRGTYDPETMLRIAGTLPLTGQRVPSDWAEGRATSLAQGAVEYPGLLVAEGLEGFSAPAVRVEGTTATVSYVGAGARQFLLTQARGTVLSPPFDADTVGVEVRGRHARFTPSRGVLEWVEDGTVVSLESESLGLDELVGIAALLEPYR